jgi:type VI secretion system protein ImpH
VIRQLLDEPYRFEFFQAVRLLEKISVEDVRFKNSRDLRFPPSQIEALTLVDARACITPAFFGFLGNHGALPAHYDERIARHPQAEQREAAYAYLDIFSNRMAALFYEAWRKHRLELPRRGGGGDGLLPLMLALAGGTVQAVPDQVAAYYAAQFAHRPPSSLLVQQVLHDYLGIPVAVTPNVGRWHKLEQGHQLQLGSNNCRLGADASLGERMWRRDIGVAIQLGPLDKAQYEDFLKDAPGALVLKNMLAMFETPALRYEVQLVLAASEVGGVALAASCANARLGIDTYLLTGPETRDRADMRYVV